MAFRSCDSCGLPFAWRMRCKCREAAYCDSWCAEKDWQTHKQTCWWIRLKKQLRAAKQIAEAAGLVITKPEAFNAGVQPSATAPRADQNDADRIERATDAEAQPGDDIQLMNLKGQVVKCEDYESGWMY